MVVLLPFGGLCLLYVALFESQAATMLITKDAQHWQNFPKNNGVAFVISPGLRACVRVKVADFLAHRIGLLVNPSLKKLEDEERVSPLPPFDVQMP